MCPCSFRISCGFGFSLACVAPNSALGSVAEAADPDAAEPTPAGVGAVPAGGGDEVEEESAAGSIKSLVFPEKKIDLRLSSLR